MKKLMAHLLSLLGMIFGSINYKPPFWLQKIGRAFASLGSKLGSEHQHHKKRFYGAVAGVVLLVGAGGATYYWYLNRPQPVKLSVNGSEIEPTPLKKDAKPDIYKINFGGSAAKLSDVGKVIEKGIHMNPQLAGTWKWVEDDRLTFTVDGDWPIGQTIHIELERQLFPKHVHLETYEIDLKTPEFKIEMYNTEFYQNPKKAAEKKVVTEAHFSHPVDPKSLEEKIKFTYLIGGGEGRVVKEQPVDFEVSYDEFYGKAFISSENLSIPNYESKMRIEIVEGVQPKRPGEGSKGEKEVTATVPGMLTHFRITSADLSLVRNDQYEPEQVVVFNSTAAVEQEELSEHLEVYTLPKDRPALPNDKKVRQNYHWTVQTVSQNILSMAKKLELEPIPTEHKYSEVISYKYQEEPGIYLYILVKKGLTSFGGYRLPEGKAFVVRVPEYPKELKIMAEGSLLSLAGEKKLSVLARDMEYVRYRAQRLLPGQIAHFVTQSRGDLEEPMFSDYRFGMENISEVFSEVRPLPVVDHGKTQYSHFDFSRLLEKSQKKPKGLFHFVAEGWDQVNKRPRGPDDRRFILVTDLGILAKKAVDGSHSIFLQSISTGRPVAGAEVQVIGKNGLPVVSEVTDDNGRVDFKSLKDFKNEKEPVVFVASKGNDLSFLPVHSHVNRINYSRFDVGGVYTRSQGEQIESYMFSDRGIYRPGEKVQVGYIIKHSDWSRDLSGLSFEIKVTDPKGSLIRFDKDIEAGRYGLNSYDFATGETWPTGRYNISLYLRKGKWRTVHIGSTSVKIEEFMPDRLKIAARFSRPPNKGWLKPKDLKGLVNLQNLFGTPAQNRRIKGEMTLAPSFPSFHAYNEWKFHDPMRSKKSFSEQLGEKVTDKEGNATFDLGLDKYESASYLLRFIAEGFEAEGGRSVMASNAVLISPLGYLVGYKAEGDLNYISKNTDIGVQFIAVDPDLKKIAVDGLKTKLVEFRQVSTLVKQSNGTYKYESVKKEYDLETADLKIEESGARLQLDTSKPGDFALVVLSSEGLELNRVPYSVAGSGNLTFELEKNAELQVKLNKSDYDPGEEIEISIRAPYTGAGLITVERERIYTAKWFQANTKSTVQKVRIPSDLEGNGYINVTFVRSLSSDEIFMSPFSTGVAPFSINKASRVNKISLEVPPLVRPGKDLAINVSAQRRGKAIVFAVDEGILQVAKYQTPDPLSHFYKKRALEVETRQILDLILPEFSKIALRRSSEAGGAASLLGKNLNPFKRKRDKAVAYWSGVIDVGPQTKALSYEVPDYFAGQLRLMAVAVSQEAMDAASEKTLVKGHFVLSPNIPNFVAPGDNLKVSVGVSNNVEGSGKGAEVNVSLATSESISVEGKDSVSLKIDEGSEASVSFDVLVKEPLGNASFVFTARHQDKESQRTVSASVRPATPYITSVQAGSLDAGDNKALNTPRRMYEEFRTNEVSVSKLPMSLANSFVSYLRKYPYGCTEQTISKAFPSVILGEYKEFISSKADVASQVQGVTEILAARQLPDGGFVKWPGHSTVDAFHTAYAVHYLTEARERGYRIPRGLMDQSLGYLKDFSEREPKNLEMARVQSYAAYLLTRNEIIATKALTSLEKWLDGYKDESWLKDVLLLYMAGAYKMMKADDKATSLLSRFDEGGNMPQDYAYGVFDNSIKRAMHLYLIARHFPEKLSEFDSQRLKPFVAGLSKNYNTTSSALAILAFEAYGQKVKADSTEGIAVQAVVEKKDVPLQLQGRLFPQADFAPNSEEVQISNETKNVAFYSLTQAGFDKGPTKTAMAEGIEVFREYVDQEGQPVTKVQIGDEVRVRLQSRSIKGQYAPNIAIIDLLPGGFEVVIDSVDRSSNAAEYVDIREDRVLVFQNLSSEVTNFEYKIKAINKGTYKVPPVFSESMYNRSLQAKGTTQEIVVE